MKRYVVECMGAFFVVLAISLTENPLAVGLVYLAMLYIGARVSGAHYNPAISVAMWLRGALETDRLPWYIVAQVVGAVAAIFLEFKLSNSLYVPDVSPEDTLALVCLLELLFAFVLTYLFLVVRTTSAFKNTQLYGIILGLSLIGLISMGGLYNPAIGVASLLLNLFMSIKESGDSVVNATASLCVYVVCPLVGGALAGFAFDYLEVPATGQFASIDSAE